MVDINTRKKRANDGARRIKARTVVDPTYKLCMDERGEHYYIDYEKFWEDWRGGDPRCSAEIFIVLQNNVVQCCLEEGHGGQHRHTCNIHIAQWSEDRESATGIITGDREEPVEKERGVLS